MSQSSEKWIWEISKNGNAVSYGFEPDEFYANLRVMWSEDRSLSSLGEERMIKAWRS